MNERMARDVTLVRAIEMTDAGRELWGDADRVWASRVAAEAVGASASDDAFLAQRASLVLERIARRHPSVQLHARVPATRAWLTPIVATGAFIVGVLGVDIGAAHRINLLAPPVLGLLVWNVAVYAALLASLLPLRGRGVGEGPLRRNVATWLRDIVHPLRKTVTPRPMIAANARFAADWSTLAAPLWQWRAARLLHVGAAMLAAGAIAGLYLRGIALEYRAVWQSTFLDAGDVARILRVVLAPGSWMTGMPIPDAAHLQTIAAGSAGENAARWIHLYAATILLVVIVPRLALAGTAWVRERRLVRRFPIALEHPYFRRLLHAWHQGTAHVAVLAYSFDVPKRNAEALAQILMRGFQSEIEIEWSDVTVYGADEAPGLPPRLAAAVALFNLTATPERENHGAFVAALVERLAGRVPLIAIVDTSDFVSRFADNARRISERQASWQRALAAAGVEPMFARLADPDVPDAAAALMARFEQAAA